MRGNTLLGTLVIILFLGSLALFSLRLSPSYHEELKISDEAKPQVFPLKRKFSVIANGMASTVSLEELFKDKEVLLINFWATWCPPCLDEIPTLEYLGKQLALNPDKKTPRLVTISVDEDPKEVQKLFKTFEFSPLFLVLHDPDGDFATSLGTTKFPETFLIDRSGNVLKKWVGPQNWLSGNIIQNLTLR